MSVSIYYKFKASSDLESPGVLKKIEEEWSKAFDGSPYESWCWYKPVCEKKLLRKSVYTYEGATKLPMDDELGPKSVFIATKLLTLLRRKVGGVEWSVNLDDLEIHWDSQNNKYELS